MINIFLKIKGGSAVADALFFNNLLIIIFKQFFNYLTGRYILFSKNLISFQILNKLKLKNIYIS